MVLTTEDRFNAGFSNFVSKLFEEKIEPNRRERKWLTCYKL